MKKFSQQHLTFCIGLSCGLASISSSAIAQEIPTAEKPNVASAPKTERAVSWRDDARLSAKISLQAKRMPLGETLAALSGQSGIALDGGDLAKTKRVTLSVRDMELRAAMVALEDLYQADWQTQGDKGYRLQAREMLPWQRNLAQLGNIDDWGYYRTNWSRPFAPPYLTAEYAFDWEELMQSLDERALKSPEGVPFSSLPEAMQNEIRRVTSWAIKHEAIEGAALRNEAEADWKLRIRPATTPPFDANTPLPRPKIVTFELQKAEIVTGDRPLASFPLPAPRTQTAQNVPDDADATR